MTSDGGLILVRELDERLGFGALIDQHLTDSRRGKNTQFPFADLVRQSVYSRLAGYEDLNDAEKLSQDPAFRLIGSEKVWDRGAALTSRLQTFETEMLAEEENFAGLGRLNRALVGRAEAMDSDYRTILDMDSTEIPVYGEQEHSAYNGHFESTCYHPLLLFNREGDCLGAKLRPGNVHSAEGWEELLLPEIERQQRWGKEVVFRADAAFAKPEIYEALEEQGVKHAVRIPANEPGTGHRRTATTPGEKAESEAAGGVQGIPVPGGELEDGTPSGREGGTSRRGAVPTSGLHRDQPDAAEPGGGAVLQQAWHRRAVDQGRQAGGEDDAAQLPPVPTQRSAAVAERDRLQPGEPVAAVGAATEDWQLVAHQLAATAGEDRRPIDQARPVLLAAAG